MDKICPFSSSDFLGLFDDDDSDGYAEDDDPDDVTNGTSQWRRPSNDAMCELWMHVANSSNLPSSNKFHIKGYNQQIHQHQLNTDDLNGAAENYNDGQRMAGTNRSTRSHNNERFAKFALFQGTHNHNQPTHQHQIDTDDNNRNVDEDEDTDGEMTGACQWQQSSNDGTFGQQLYVANMRNLPSSTVHVNPTLQDKNTTRKYLPIDSTLF